MLTDYGKAMDLSGPAPQSFIVKIWLEETAEEAGRALWRGHITHVPSGERRYIQDLDQIEEFIMPYLEDMGVRSQRRLVRQAWTRRLKWLFGRSRGFENHQI